MKIIKYKKEHNDNYKLYLEDGSTINLYEEVILENKLLFKEELDANTIDKIIKDNDFEKIYNACVRYISIRVRSVKEIKEYLSRKKISLDTSKKVLDRLTDNKLLNDEYFTECYIKDKLNLTSWGENKIRNNLRDLGIDNSIIDKYNYLFNYETQKEKVKKIISKSIKNKPQTDKLKYKIYTNLINLGYNKELILEELNNNF